MYTEQINGLIPIADGYSHGIRVNVALPFDLGERIAVNAAYTHSLLQIAGFRHLHIVNDQSKEISTQHHMVAGVNPDGAAMAGRAVSTQVPMHHYSIENVSYTPLRKQARWADLKVQINVPEVQNRLLNQGKSVRDTQAWSREIDKGLKRSLVTAGTKYLVWGDNLFDRSYYTCLNAFNIFWPVVGAHGGLISSDATTIFLMSTGLLAFSSLFQSLLDYAQAGREHDGSGRRLSLFQGFEIDRMLVLLIQSSRNQTVKPLK